MVVEHIRYTIEDARAQAFEQAYRRSGRSIAGVAALRTVRGLALQRGSDQYVVRIEWDSEEGHMTGFRQSPEFRSFFEAVGPFVHDIEEMRHYQVTCVERSMRTQERLSPPSAAQAAACLASLGFATAFAS